ncbi:MAG: PQQ-binding-like beta-propeller repeat protein [Planctomycetia bacterium]|nr:PQQ-binding-like beta-propeller repeat protein [Planctomycetia bacterium]
MPAKLIARLLTGAVALLVLALLVTSDAAQQGQPARRARQAQPARVQAAALKPVEQPTAAAVKKIDPLDWPNWRGPEQNGISRETGLIDSWDPKSGKNLLWKSAELRTRSTPIVMNGKLYTLARSEPATHAEGEKVICADAATGKVLWENKFNVFLSDVPDTRVAWSCCVGDPVTGRVYAMGVCGYFQCIDGETGKTIWSHSLNEEYGLLSTYGGRTNVPILFEDLTIISAVMTSWGELARPVHRFLAFNKATGELVWMSGTRPLPDDTTYSTPTLAVIKGQPLMIFGSGDGSVWAFQPRTGKPVWSFRFSLRGMNVSPLVDGETIYMGQSEENWDDSTMGALGAYSGVLPPPDKVPAATNKAPGQPGGVDITKTNELWRVKELMVGKSSPLLVDGRLYALDDSNIVYVRDAKTGAEVGKKARLVGTITRASPLHADGKIYACTTSAWHVLTPSDDGVKIAQRLRFPDGEEIHGSPVVSHGRIYLPTTEYLYCLGKADAKPAATKRPEPAREAPLAANAQPAQVQVIPAEALIKPGEKVKFRARLFNALGQFIKDTDAMYSVEGPGQIDKQGQFTADSSAGHAGAIVTAKVGDSTGTARVRIEPPLPWKFDFADKQVPVTWVGARYRHQIREMDGEQVMVKITTIPKGTRSQSWMGPTDLHDYCVQADVRGSIAYIDVPAAAGGESSGEKEGKMPDIGLIAQRYTLDLMGASQQVQIRSWTAMLDRFSKSVPFAWKPDTWYTMKFQANVVDGKALLRGKVWPRGQSEPKEWTIEAVDETPNLTGSPGLFGNASNAELFYDNILVTPASAK